MEYMEGPAVPRMGGVAVTVRLRGPQRARHAERCRGAEAADYGLGLQPRGSSAADLRGARTSAGEVAMRRCRGWKVDSAVVAVRGWIRVAGGGGSVTDGPPRGPLETVTGKWVAVGLGLTGVGNSPPRAPGRLTALASHDDSTNGTSACRGGGRAFWTADVTRTRILDTDTDAAATYLDATCGAGPSAAACTSTCCCCSPSSLWRPALPPW